MSSNVFKNYAGSEDLFHVDFNDISDFVKISAELESLSLNCETQFTGNLYIKHINECTEEVKKAIELFINRGWILNNIIYLVPDYNLKVETLKSLNLNLLRWRVRPYAFIIDSTSHINLALKVLESLRGWTSGLAVPHLLLKEEHGFQHILPNYIKYQKDEVFVFRNYKNHEFYYENLPNEENVSQNLEIS